MGPSLAPGSIISNAYSTYVAPAWQVVFDLTGPGTNIFNTKIAAPYFANKGLVGDDLDGNIVSAASMATGNFAGSGEISGGGINATTAAKEWEKLKKGSKPKTIESVGMLCHLEGVEDQICIEQLHLVWILIVLILLASSRN